MAEIIVKLHGEELNRLSLEPATEYIAGRSHDCDIVLPESRGISRRHIKFYEHNGIWIAEIISRFGSIISAGDTVESIQLYNACVFSIPPYEFIFLDQPEMDAPKTPESTNEPEYLPTALETTNSGNLEATASGISNLSAYVVIHNDNEVETLQLEGQLLLVRHLVGQDLDSCRRRAGPWHCRPSSKPPPNPSNRRSGRAHR